MNLSIPGPSSRSSGYSTFAKLCREDTDDIADFGDEKPPVATGKRVMFAEVEDDGPLRPARRVVHLFALSRRSSVFDYSLPPHLSSSLLPRPPLVTSRVEASQGKWSGNFGGRPGLVFSRMFLVNSSSLQAMAPASGTGTAIGNKKKAAPKRR